MHALPPPFCPWEGQPSPIKCNNSQIDISDFLGTPSLQPPPLLPLCDGSYGVLSVLSEVTVFFLKVVLGLHIVRGDNICVVGEIDEDIDSRLDLHNLKAEPINAVPHGI